MYFSQYGALEECRVILDESGMSKQFAFVSYSSPLVSQKVAGLAHAICGSRVHVERCAFQEHTDNFEFSIASKRLFVSLTGFEDIDETLLRSHFSNSGQINNVTLERNIRSGPPIYAVVTFESDKSVDDAVDSVHILGGKTLVVKKMISSEEVKKGMSDGNKVRSHRISIGEKKVKLETLLDDLLDILTTKIYTVNRRLSGVVEIGDHDAKSRNVLEKANAQTGIIHKLITKQTIFSQECYAVCTVNRDENSARLVTNWIDKTSAEKFVFEDCGIATYLSVCDLAYHYRLIPLFWVLWKSRGLHPRRFIDVGCGNGLLVHLLNRLGYSGCGVDLRERKTWKGMFPQDELLECTIDPSSSKSGMPNGIDYLIGNHSDELTPWIPLLAARLSIPFFLLPCCPFDFYGKLPRKGTASLYEELILYVKKISERLGYAVEIDKLSIPSTKRTALICTVPSSGLRKDLEEEIDRLLEESKKGRVFTARSKVEKVRNCSSIEKSIRETLINRVFNRLLEGEEKGEVWRKGKCLPLSQIVSILSVEEKKLMKEQCGGVQTFLKNQHQIFKVISGTVCIRDWREETRSVPEGK
ncbi:hypothetical protein PRIPAC_94363, partial [Pristionchus pacificus]|uniref:tRNA (uracil-O(2)-)-methyltransferase n=1 Tax=Pristionchus pacificus TaxID=54126 RepID=A0A8R1UD13_PRIPA